MLKDAVLFLGPNLGFTPKDVTARSLRAAVSMALLCSSVETNIIKLVGRWRSYGMLRYLHMQVETLMRNVPKLMVQSGSYYIHTNHEVPNLVP